MKKRILFVDDDVVYLKFITHLLENEGYTVISCNNVLQAIEWYHKEEFDLVLSDLMMDSVDGMQLLSYIRNYGKETKMILLTACGEDSNEVKALTMLADDYIRKPVMSEVLLARIARALVNGTVTREVVLVSEQEELRVDIGAHRVYKGEEQIYLTAREFSLLEFFLRNKNKTFSRTQLLREVWRVQDDSIDLRSVDALVKKLRAKLSLTSIFSIRGVGYEWVEE